MSCLVLEGAKQAAVLILLFVFLFAMFFLFASVLPKKGGKGAGHTHSWPFILYLQQCVRELLTLWQSLDPHPDCKNLCDSYTGREAPWTIWIIFRWCKIKWDFVTHLRYADSCAHWDSSPYLTWTSNLRSTRKIQWILWASCPVYLLMMSPKKTMLFMPPFGHRKKCLWPHHMNPSGGTA